MRIQKTNLIQMITLVALLLATSILQAATVTARLDRNNAVVGETVTLTLQTNDTEQSLDTDLTALEEDFHVLDRRSETQMSFVNGRKTAYVRLVITLEPKRAGVLRIPALNFPGASSAALNLKVVDAPAPAPGAAEPVFIEVTVIPDRGPYYVLSQVGLMVRIFYQTNLTEAAINPPAPLQASVRLLDEVPYQAERNGVKYRVLERRYAIFPERSGTLTIPPMQLSGRLIERPSDRLWRPAVRGRRVRVESEPIQLVISPRPDQFTGDSWLPARRITLSQKISDNESLHVGEPVTRTVILDAVGLEEHMLQEPVWPEIPDTRIYPDQPQGISRDNGEWVLGHKEFRYAIVPENAGELVLPEIRLDWWDTINHRQRTAILPEHRLTVLASELVPVAAVIPPVAGPPEFMSGGPGGDPVVVGNLVFWQSATAALLIVWLLTWYFYYRKASVLLLKSDANGAESLEEKDLLKQFQQACRKNDAVAARRDLAQWIRNYSPPAMRGGMRDFGVACGDDALRVGIAELDASGFALEGDVAWTGGSLWTAFRTWQRGSAAPQKARLGNRPELYKS